MKYRALKKEARQRTTSPHKLGVLESQAASDAWDEVHIMRVRNKHSSEEDKI